MAQPRGAIISIIEGIFAQFHTILCGGMFLAAFAVYVKANAFQIGVMNAIPSIVGATGFLSAYVVNRIGFRKQLCVGGLVTGRLLFTIIACFLWLEYPISIALIPSGACLRFIGIPGRSYTTERAPAVTGPWNTLATPTAPLDGLIECVDANAPAASAFYRTVRP